MSRSYRRPYCAVTGVRSAKHDKLVARRCWRRAQEQAIRDCHDWEELVIPKRLEASFNDVWSWGRDGKQTLQFPSKPEPVGIWIGYSFREPDEEWDKVWVRYYERLCRK